MNVQAIQTPLNQDIPSPLNVLDAAAANGSFKNFGLAVEKAGLSDKLRGPGLFTLLAPTDAAFEKLPPGRLEELFKPENKVELASIINYHLLGGQKSVEDMSKWENARTINGQPAPVKRTEGRMTIDGAYVTLPDIVASNGVVHGIDKVNMPVKPH